LSAAEPSAAELFREGRIAERAGDVVRAYLLYAEAAAKDPSHVEYWARCQALRTRAALQAKVMPKLALPGTGEPQPPAPEGPISAEDLAAIDRLKPPPELKPTPGRKDLDLRGDSKSVFEQAAHAFGLDTIFDGDYQAGPPLHIRIEDADYRQALHTLEAATGAFVVPVGERLFLVAKDTAEKRAQVEPVVAIAIPIPEPVTVAEAQELAHAVQQAMEIVKFAVDAERHMVVIKDRLSKVRPAQALFEQLAHSRAEVEVEVQFLEVDRSSLITYGLLLPNDFPIVFVGSGGTAGAANPKPRDRNVTLFRDSTAYMFVAAFAIVLWADGRWGVPVAMTIATVLIYFLSRHEARPYSWWSVLPIAVAGWATACMDLPRNGREFLPVLIGGAWLLSRGTWTLARYLRAHPRPVALEPGAHE